MSFSPTEKSQILDELDDIEATLIALVAETMHPDGPMTRIVVQSVEKTVEEIKKSVREHA